MRRTERNPDPAPRTAARVRRHRESRPVTAAPRLFSFYAAAIGFGLAIDAQDPAHPLESTGAEAQQRMRRLVERANAAARAQGKPGREVDSAAFAVVAWFDEVAARRKDWVDAIAPLQLLWFNSTNAATEFFHHLAALRPEQGELRELYWYLLAIGFKGQYYFEGEGGTGELAKLRAMHAAQLPQPPLDLHAPVQRLCPQPYAQPMPAGRLRGAARPPRPARRWPFLLALALILLPPAAWLWHKAAPQPPAPTELAARVAQQLQRHACAALNAEQGRDGVLHVSGFVPREEDIALVHQEVAALAGTTPTRVQLQQRPWPYCEVVDILQAHQRRNAQARNPLALHVPAARGGSLREGDGVSLQVRAPAAEGVLWVDYYTADGAVLHLRAQGQRRVSFGPGQSFVFGEDLPSSWLVSPPFGTVLVTAVAVPAHAPLAAGTEPPPFELASAYLLRLRETLAAAGAAAPLAALLFLQTRER